MVPFDEDPVAMDIGGGTYPKAGAVTSLGTVPARVTLPIACGEIKRVQQ